MNIPEKKIWILYDTGWLGLPLSERELLIEVNTIKYTYSGKMEVNNYTVINNTWIDTLQQI